MMEWFRLILFVIVVHLFRTLLKEQVPIFSFLLGMMAIISVYLYIITPLSDIFQLFESFLTITKTQSLYMRVIFKMIGISYLIDFFQLLLKDAQAFALAMLVETIGKVMLLIISIPIIEDMFQFILTLID